MAKKKYDFSFMTNNDYPNTPGAPSKTWGSGFAQQVQNNSRATGKLSDPDSIYAPAKIAPIAPIALKQTTWNKLKAFDIKGLTSNVGSLGELGKGLMHGPLMQQAADGYRQDGQNILYAAQQEALAQEKRKGITPVATIKSYLNPLSSSLDFKNRFDALKDQTPYIPTTTAGKLGNLAGGLIGNAPAFALGGAATENISQNILGKLAPRITSKLLPWANTAVKGGLSFGAIAPMETNRLSDLPMNIAKNTALGAGMGLGFHGAGVALKPVGDAIGKGLGGLVGALKPRGVSLPPIEATPLRTPPAGAISLLNQKDLLPIGRQALRNPIPPNPLLLRALSEKPLTQANRRGLNPPIGPLAENNLGPLLPRSIPKNNLDPLLPRAILRDNLGPLSGTQQGLGIPSLGPSPLSQSRLPLGPGKIEPLLPQKLDSPLSRKMEIREASTHPVAEHIMSKLDDLEAGARARIASNRGRLNAGLPVDTMVDYSIIGAVKIARGTVKYSVWASDMANDLGSSIKPHLKEIWEQSNQQHSLMVDGTFSTALPEPQSKIIIGKSKEPFSFNNAWDKFYTGVVNTQQPIVNAAKVAESDMGKLASNTKNVSGIVDHNFLRAMVDKDGNKVGASLKSTVEAIPKGQEGDFWTYMSQRHNIDRARQESHQVPKVDKQGFLIKDKDRNQVYDTVVTKKPTPVQANYTPNMSSQAVRNAEQAHPEYKAIGDGIAKWLDDFMQTWGVDTGIVDKDIYKGLRETYKSYFPTQRDFSTLEKAIPDNVSQKFSDQRSPIRKATGSERDIVDPIENIMQLVNRTIRTAKYNEVGQSLLTAVKENPAKMKQFAEILPSKDGMSTNTDNVISVLVDGKSIYVQINNKMLLDSMNGLPKSIGNIPVLSTLTNGFKGLITQKNPLFAIRNIFRDVPTAYVYGSEPNPLKFGAGLLGAGKDILTNSPRLQKYQAVGGGGANFFNSGDVSKSATELLGKGNTIKKILVAPIHAIEKFNNLTETAPRLAEFNRVLGKTGDVTKALFAANDVSVNFSRGGNLTKNIDKGVPYLNAGVQGLDKFFRGFANPKTALATIVKSGVAITAPDLALYMVNKDDPSYQALDNRTKDSNFLIPKGDGTFIKIPKSRELGVLFGSLFERGLRAAEGQEGSFKGFANTVATNFSPANPFDSNILAPATWNIATNKDFANRAIVPQGMLMDKRSKYLQYDDKTTSISKAIGELSASVIPGGISPKQLDYLVKSYSGVIGQFGMPLATPGGSPGKTLASQFTADPAFSNQAATDFYDKLDKLSAVAADNNILGKIPSKELTPEEDIRNSMNVVSLTLSRGTKLINTIQASSDPLKDDKIRAIKIQMLDMTRKAALANDPRSMQTVENDSKNMFTK